MNLNDSMESMTPLFGGTPVPPAFVPAAPHHEKNIGTVQMDSTPISDVMGDEAPQYMQQQQAPMVAPQKKAAATANPMNLTTEQMEALLAGLVSLIAFSGPVQDKLASFLPQMIGEGGGRSNTGLLITALVAALIFYFGRRFVVK